MIGRKQVGKQTPTVARILDNVYTGPSLWYLQHYDPTGAYVFGTVRVTGLEIQSGLTDEGAFVALLSAKLQSTLGEMAAGLSAPTLPVHDEPAHA